ncbi:class I SAM-dependent methyltransferase [Streptomyces sp. NPDC050418]|uniref:class I SAM-dependent methyltransferase n=1 Tax=Streptomyces sp. NPDC050418 TaxID=3365612 RepID=UPI003792F390
MTSPSAQPLPDLAYLDAVRESYDTVAAAYADQVPSPEALDPVSRGLLGAFAESVREGGGGGVVADVGCGPGYITAYLAGLGLSVTGVDLSPEMVRIARRRHPGLPFAVGSMTALPFADGALGGLLAYYSLHHTPPEALPLVCAEFRRVLAPGGRLMVAGHVGAGEVRRPAHAYGGHPVSWGSYLRPPEEIAGRLSEAGLRITTRVVQEPTGGGKWATGTFLAEPDSQAEPDSKAEPDSQAEPAT